VPASAATREQLSDREVVFTRVLDALRMTFADAEGMRKAVEIYGVLEGGTQTLDRMAEHVRTLE
jgi:hypothetical protein